MRVVDDPDEAGLAALVGALRHAVGARGGEEEHVPGLDEAAVRLADLVARRLVEPIGEARVSKRSCSVALPVVVALAHRVVPFSRCAGCR